MRVLASLTLLRQGEGLTCNVSVRADRAGQSAGGEYSHGGTELSWRLSVRSQGQTWGLPPPSRTAWLPHKAPGLQDVGFSSSDRYPWPRQCDRQGWPSPVWVLLSDLLEQSEP